MRFRYDSMMVYIMLGLLLTADIIAGRWIGGFLGVLTGLSLIYLMNPLENQYAIEQLLWWQ